MASATGSGSANEQGALGNGSVPDQVQMNPTNNPNHPLYLHTSDISGISLVSFHLTGTKNYSL